MYKLTDAQAPVWSEAAQRHDVEPPASVGAVLATAHGAHHDVVEIRCNRKTDGFEAMGSTLGWHALQAIHSDMRHHVVQFVKCSIMWRESFSITHSLNIATTLSYIEIST